jgi:hypothetical protein
MEQEPATNLKAELAKKADRTRLEYMVVDEKTSL